jgi:hypothetical protein
VSTLDSFHFFIGNTWCWNKWVKQDPPQKFLTCHIGTLWDTWKLETRLVLFVVGACMGGPTISKACQDGWESWFRVVASVMIWCKGRWFATWRNRMPWEQPTGQWSYVVFLISNFLVLLVGIKWYPRQLN